MGGGGLLKFWLGLFILLRGVLVGVCFSWGVVGLYWFGCEVFYGGWVLGDGLLDFGGWNDMVMFLIYLRVGLFMIYDIVVSKLGLYLYNI